MNTVSPTARHCCGILRAVMPRRHAAEMDPVTRYTLGRNSASKLKVSLLGLDYLCDFLGVRFDRNEIQERNINEVCAVDNSEASIYDRNRRADHFAQLWVLQKGLIRTSK